MNETLRAPSPAYVMREARGLIELPRLLLRFPSLARQPRGNGEPVLILPGYGAGDGSTMILKGYLRLLSYRARGWGLSILCRGSCDDWAIYRGAANKKSPSSAGASADT
jgi:hypothetical protein